MGDCHCSNIAIMQLFHELKQQFPALPDHVVSQCIAQNSHDKETCARSLRATQESRPPSGAFPPPPPPDTLTSINSITMNHMNHVKQVNHLNNVNHSNHSNHAAPRPHRPASLDIGVAHICPRTKNAAPASAPAACSSRGFFDDLTNPNAGFELNVNVECSPAGNRDFRTIPVVGTCKRSALLVEPQPHYIGQVPEIGGLTNGLAENSRSYTSVSLTLRPPSSDPQPPINIRSHGSSLTYSTSSVDPRGFQSRLQISIGPGALGSVASARIRPPMGPTRPTTLLPPATTSHRPPGLPAGPPSQLPRPTTTVSAPTTPSGPTNPGHPASNSLPTTPASPLPSSFTTNLINPGSNTVLTNTTIADYSQSPINKVADHQKQLVAEQMVRRNRLAKELQAEKGKLDAMKRELQYLARPLNATIPPQHLERKLRSEIYQLQVECDRMASEVDPTVPLGETSEEFYQSIYTGQPFVPFAASNPLVIPPPLPSRPPAWAPVGDREERDGPSWVCRMCTFGNHPLMDKCEQCDMPRLPSHSAGETQDIHIRVTHHHNFSPRRTVHSWVV